MCYNRLRPGALAAASSATLPGRDRGLISESPAPDEQSYSGTVSRTKDAPKGSFFPLNHTAPAASPIPLPHQRL